MNNEPMPTFILDEVQYQPILTPQERIKNFLSDLENDKFHEDNKSGIALALRIAKVWFRDELEIIERS